MRLAPTRARRSATRLACAATSPRESARKLLMMPRIFSDLLDDDLRGARAPRSSDASRGTSISVRAAMTPSGVAISWRDAGGERAHRRELVGAREPLFALAVCASRHEELALEQVAPCAGCAARCHRRARRAAPRATMPSSSRFCARISRSRTRNAVATTATTCPWSRLRDACDRRARRQAEREGVGTREPHGVVAARDRVREESGSSRPSRRAAAARRRSPRSRRRSRVSRSRSPPWRREARQRPRPRARLARTRSP